MPKSIAKAPRSRRKGGRPRGRTARVARRRDTRGRPARSKNDPLGAGGGLACVTRDGEPIYVLVPLDKYECLVKAEMVQSAIAKLETGDETEWIDADDFALELAAERIAEARKTRGLTQKELGAKLNLPQSQISRIERNPDRTTVRTLKRIARALGVDVGALI